MIIIFENQGLGDDITLLHPLPNPWRSRAAGRMVLHMPITLYCDDTSGNQSKRWNKHVSFFFTLSGLAPRMTNQNFHCHYVTTSNVANVVHLAAAKTPQATTNLLSSLGSHSLDWGTRFGAIFDKKKAQFMWLTRRVHPLDPFNFGNQALKPCDSVKWLGVIIDKKLTYTAMFAHLEQKGTKTLNQLKQLGNSRWGLRERDRV
jgi:hypothetical protein